MAEKESWYARTELMLGKEGMERLFATRVAVFGVGGVGGYVVEALARAGVGALDLFDPDTVSETNLNRQIIALRSTLGQYKTDVAAARAKDINPAVKINTSHLFYLPEIADQVDLSVYDYIVDAVDTVAAKIELIRRAKKLGVPIISSMGTGNKLDPTRFRISDIEKTSVCPLARTMRGLCRREGLKHVKVLWSAEQPQKVSLPAEHGRHAPGSISFVPAAAGLCIAAEVVRDLLR
ncbi:MAG: tRNA threonylcarbamoyladenosine dehydratase [Ruminococcaceae bacterium]|nr:tRNA threonylcarbamoyladenosine dehydratase [Oscillospiraceae bacterium]